MGQREKMKELYRKFGGNEDLVVKEYAQAEQRGEVTRDSNDHDFSPENYARRLLNDGLSKGWLTD